MSHPVTASLYPPDYEAVPTVEELQSMGLAHLTHGTGQRFQLSPGGQAAINMTMRRNAERVKAWRAQHAR